MNNWALIDLKHISMSVIISVILSHYLLFYVFILPLWKCIKTSKILFFFFFLYWFLDLVSWNFILRYIKIGYNINVIRQTACMVVNPVTVNNFASLFGCTPAGRASDSMTAPTWRLLSKSVGAWCSGSAQAHRSPIFGFLLLQHFSYFLLSSPHRCFIFVFLWFLCSRRCCTDE